MGDKNDNSPLPQRPGARGRGGNQMGRGGNQGGRGGNQGGRGGNQGGGGQRPQNQQQGQNNQQNNNNSNNKQPQPLMGNKPNERNGANNSEDNGGAQRGGQGPPRGGRGGGRGGNNGNFRGNRSDRGPGASGDMNESRMGSERFFTEKILSIQGPTLDLPPQDTVEKNIKFGNNCRLYIGNFTNDITESEVTELFKPYGETSELFLNKEKMFGFVRVDYKHNADKAKSELDGKTIKGRALKVRFAPINASIRVKNLSSCVTNELLELAFGVFGDIERAVVIVDDRGQSKCEGIVEFVRKPAAAQALRRCAEGCFFLTQSLRPVIVEPLELYDEIDGLTERTINKKNPEYFKQRQVGPRFATVDSFEFEYGSRWKQLHELFKQKEESLKRELKMEEEKLEAQMEYAKYEHETEMLRKELAQREIDRERQKQEWEMKERQAEEFRRRDEEIMKKHAEEMQSRMAQQEEEMRRRQIENNAFKEQMQRAGGNGGNNNNNGRFNSPARFGDTQIDFDSLAAAVGSIAGGGNAPNDKGGNMDFERAGNDRRGGNDASSGWSRREQQGGGRWGPSINQDMNNRRGGSGGGPPDYQSKRRRY